MKIVGIDFETFWDTKSGYTLDKMTTEAYIRDPRFQTIGVAVSIGTNKVWMEHDEFQRFASRVDWSHFAILCHHTHFDGLILSHHYGVKPGLWLDTLSMARALHAHETRLNLGVLMQFFGVGEKGTYVYNMDGYRREDMTPEQWMEYGVYSINDIDGTEKIFAKMLPGFPRDELQLIDMTIRMFTEPQFVADEAMLIDFWQRETRRRATLFADLMLDKKTFTSPKRFANLLSQHGVDPPMKKSPKWIDEVNEKWIYAFAKTDPAMQLLLEDEDDTIRWFAEARIESKSTLDMSRTERFIKLGANGQAMPVYLKYCAAHTLRWGGGDKLNWQNLRRVNKKKPDQGVIKRSIMSPEGYVVVRADSSQIEARGSGWFCGQEDLTMQFANHEDVYSLFASDVFQRVVNRKLVLADGSEPDFIPGFLAKVCVLGLGYSMGWYKLAMEFMKGALGGPPLVFKREDMEIMGISPYEFMNNPYKIRQVEEMPSRLALVDRLIHCAVCDFIMNKWRKKNDMIVDMWEYLDEQVIPAMAEKQEIEFGPGYAFRTGNGGIILPNGLTMKYTALSHKKRASGESYQSGGWSYQIEPNRRSKIYGGLLLQNLMEAVCRIIIGEQALKIREYGFPAKTLTHDEIVTLALEWDAPEVLAVMLDTMRTAPTWAAGFPLDAEGGYHKRYGDAK